VSSEVTEMRKSRVAKSETHKRIIDIAARRFRERGLEGVSIAKLMEDAGLTIGGFYRHFDSKEALIVETVDRAFHDVDVWKTSCKDISEFIAIYLSANHRDHPGKGCAMGTLAVDISRMNGPPQTFFTRKIQGNLAYFEQCLLDESADERKATATTLLSCLVGAIAISRAVAADSELSDKILTDSKHGIAALLKRKVDALDRQVSATTTK